MQWLDESITEDRAAWKRGYRYIKFFALLPYYCEDTHSWHWLEHIYAYQEPFYYDGDWITMKYFASIPKERREYPRTPGKFNDACNVAHSVIRANEKPEPEGPWDY